MSEAAVLPLAGRTAVITGGSRGLGLATAAGFAAAGADLVIASRDAENCRAVAEQLERTTGRRAVGYGIHVGKWDQLDELTSRAYSDFDRIDILVNNAGMSPLYDSPSDVTESMFDKVIAVNLRSAFRLTALFGPRMAEAGGGSIINISSRASERPRPNVLPYAAAKAGLNALTVGFAHAFGPTVRCNAIVAGTFLTDISRSWDMEAFARRSQQFAAQRAGDPSEIVGAALYLASDASSYTTGSLITVDGGQP